MHLDKRFIFYNSGFNVRSTDVSASIGLSQFKDLDKFIKIRNINRKKIINQLDKSKKMRNKIIVIKNTVLTQSLIQKLLDAGISNISINKKVADKISQMFKKDRKDFEQKWDDVKVFIEYGMLTEEKFFDKANDFALSRIFRD